VSWPVRSSRLQLDQNADATVVIEPGYSGTPLLSNDGRKAYGIVARVRNKVGYMIPSQELDRVHAVFPFQDYSGNETGSDDNSFSIGSDRESPVSAVATAIGQQEALIEVELDVNFGDFLDEDAFYYQLLIEGIMGCNGAKLKVSYIRKGSTIVAFNVNSESAANDAITIVDAINDGALKEHGVVRASIARYTPTLISLAELELRTREKPSISPTHLKVARYFCWKERFDRLIAFVMFVTLFPLLCCLTIIVWLTSGFPLYSTKRAGKLGRIFSMYMLRTTRLDKGFRPEWSDFGDPRRTTVGRFLVKSGLHKIPNLINVIRGEMSLIGPRPNRCEIHEEVGRILRTDYDSRLLIKPGITGLSAVHFPPSSTTDELLMELQCDQFYIEYATPWLDILIFLDTAFVALGVSIRLTKRYVDLALLTQSLDSPC